MHIAIGSDHIAVELKEIVSQHLKSKDIQVLDVGTDTAERTHYPIFAQRVAKAVVSKEVDFGILICGTGIGMSISANKVPGIRAACVSDAHSARMSRAHNDANVLTFGSRIVGPGLALEIVDTWLAQDFHAGRHKVRIDLIKQLDEGEDITSLT